MNAQTLRCLVFLAVIKELSCNHIPPFKLEGSPVTAIEGSCIEIQCRVTRFVNDDGAHWFWIKDAKYNNSKNYFMGTVIYSSASSVRPVNGDYADRVNYTGSQSTTWKQPSTKPVCSILICNLSKSDNGNYSLRFVGKPPAEKWKTEPDLVLTVTENPCPITFEKPPVVIENSTISLRCSTLSSCPSDLKIEGLPGGPFTSALQPEGNQKIVSHSFSANWQHDGKELSCQTKDNTDASLIRKISLTVEYAPKETQGTCFPVGGIVREGQSVTLTCSAKGHPDPTFTWFKNEQKHPGAEWKSSSIRASESGEYHCVAENKHGKPKSHPVWIDVQYTPEVEVKTSKTSSPYTFTQGEWITLTCSVIRSNPKPNSFVWLKNDAPMEQWLQTVEKNIMPDDTGFYKCQATNRVGTGTSAPLDITVRYSPRNTHISISEKDTKVKVGQSLTFICITDAYPSPTNYSWYIETDSSQSKSCATDQNSLRLESVNRTNEACYKCNATNDIGTGKNSRPVCIQVLYQPTIPKLSMVDVVSEGHPTTITCTVESFPPSQLTLKRTQPSNPKSPAFVFTHQYNYLEFTFNVTSAHRGFYTCEAKNSIGSNKSVTKELVVKYHPEDVKVQAHPDVEVNENTLLTLNCTAHSHPPVTSVTWTKTTHGKSEIIRGNRTFTVKSVSPSDGGLYSCAATNEMGTVKSQQAEIKVKYAPKQTKIIKGAEQQGRYGTKYVTLSCSSHSYPPVTHFEWYKKIEAEKRDEKVSDHQTYTVFSDKPGVYYCIAKNEINQKSSDPVQMFVDRVFVKVLIIVFFLIMLVVIVIFFVYRHKRNKSIERGHGNTPLHHLYKPIQGLWNGARRRNSMTDPVMAEPSRSRDDLQQRRPCPDNTPASNINGIYCTVNHPAQNQSASAQGPSGAMPTKQKAGLTQDESLNYASLHFGKRQKNEWAKAEVDVVYAMVTKKNPTLKKQENLQDYENTKTANGARSQTPPNNDSDTSEDEGELNYSQVSFKAKPGHQQAYKDSSTSDEEETQYSDVKF
ncbi:B-cell receptor CD22 [Labrus mixtus]|uniref:B-cell receptor CD22 n=1 Tax=Labrus mixtus TaxID=508554 RepID=UPI0029C01D1C|nr:B-cell receptor CD22 [Labrus mixtus]